MVTQQIMHCTICYTTLGIERSHAESELCPTRASFWCPHCSCYGHQASACDARIPSGIQRPVTLEELIPIELRERWNITSHTVIAHVPVLSLTLEDKEREIAASNTIEVIHKDAAIRMYMRSMQIPTAHKMLDNIQRLREWAVGRGMKLRLLSESAAQNAASTPRTPIEPIMQR